MLKSAKFVLYEQLMAVLSFLVYSFQIRFCDHLTPQISNWGGTRILKSHPFVKRPSDIANFNIMTVIVHFLIIDYQNLVFDPSFPT